MIVKAAKDLLVGTLIGIVSMLPGASGATIAVVFGIYERLISDLADIRDKLLKDLKFVVPLLLGMLLGLFVCAFGLDTLMDKWEVPMMFFFAALIVTQIPDVREMGDDGNPMTKNNWYALIAGIAIMMVFLGIGLSGNGADKNVDSFIIWMLVGVILAVSKLAPGVSGSTVLLALGLFKPFTDAMTNFDWSALIPGGIGLLIGVLGFSKILDHFFTHNRKSSYMVILGLTIGSVFTVTIEALVDLDGTTMILQSIVGIIAGLVLGVGLAKISRMYAKENKEEEKPSEA